MVTFVPGFACSTLAAAALHDNGRYGGYDQSPGMPSKNRDSNMIIPIMDTTNLHLFNFSIGLSITVTLLPMLLLPLLVASEESGNTAL